MPYKLYSRFQEFKPGRELVQTLIFLTVVFVISSLSLFLSFLLKNMNPREYGLIRGRKEDLEITYKEILFFASLVLAFFVLSVCFRYIKKRSLKMLFISLASVYLIASCFMILADSVYYLIFAYRITFSAVQTVLNTNPEEVRGFITLYFSPGRLIMLLAFISMILLVLSRRSWFIALFSTRTFFTAAALFSALGIIDFIQMAHSKGNGLHNMRYWDIIIGEYNEYREFNRRLEAEKNSHNLAKEYSTFYRQDTVPKTLVVVISESLSKKHMSLYGYSRKTTPRLDTNTRIYKFNDCVSQAALTIEAVPGLFFQGYLSKKINLIALCNKLGYETTWISNQPGWGKGDQTTVLLSRLCKKTVFTDARSDNEKANSSTHYDEEVLGEFDKALEASPNKSKLILLHLMGCHFEYEKRYPAGRSRFGSEPPLQVAVNTERSRTIINSYDNAVLYHDSVVSEITDIFWRHGLTNSSALLFLSDHGEELYDNRDHAGHGYPPCKVTSEIPCFAMLSPGFSNNYPMLEEVMKKRANTPYTSANTFYTLLRVLNIGSKTYRKKIEKNSFFSPAYDSTATRYVMGMDYSKMKS